MFTATSATISKINAGNEQVGSSKHLFKYDIEMQPPICFTIRPILRTREIMLNDINISEYLYYLFIILYDLFNEYVIFRMKIRKDTNFFHCYSGSYTSQIRQIGAY